MSVFNYNKDRLVEPEDVVCDGIYKAVIINPFADDIDIEADRFFKEIHTRSTKLRIDLAFKILNARDRHEFEEFVHQLYLKGIA